jgi:DNA polymerase (family 10)
MTNASIARALRETAALLELTGGNPFRARAFRRAARSVRGLESPATDALGDGSITEIDGIGESMAEHIADLATTGSFDLRDDLLNAVPTGLLDVLRIKGLGTTKVRTLWEELNITSLDDLEAAAKADRITSLKGFGTKTQEKILANLRLLRTYDEQRRAADAHADLAPVLDALAEADAVTQVAVTGALRRNLETVTHAHLLVTPVAPDRVADVLTDVLDAPVAATEETPADAALTTELPSGLPLVVHCAAEAAFGAALWRTTGADAHVKQFAERYGTPSPHAVEADVYAAADLPMIPPELREGRGELDAAAQDALPALLTTDDLHGSLHNHSTYSDGAHSLRAMAETARSMGLSYFGICDHSQSLQIADGLSPDAVREQMAEIHALNEDFASDDGSPFRVFSGTESDILDDGALDYDDDLLADFDFVVASVHRGMSMSKEEATARILRAIENPHTRILGHPTGRLLLVREGYPLDYERVLDACAEHSVAVELNANPYRLDLDWRWIRPALDRGVLISINPDAHATDELANVKWGVKVARKGWLTPEHCLNAKPLPDFADWVDAR